jgi:hypothetical protein
MQNESHLHPRLDKSAEREKGGTQSQGAFEVPQVKDRIKRLLN